MTAEEIICLFGLEPLLVEGGYFRETWRGTDIIPSGALPSRYRGERSSGTAIYYLVTPESFSLMHRIASDEVFHFYCGDPVLMVRLFEHGAGDTVILGTDLVSGQRPQCVVPYGTWQGMSLVEGGSWALLGTTVAPGYSPRDFETGAREVLIQSHPAFENHIVKLTR